MPLRKLTQNETFETIIQWLKENLNDSSFIKACCNEVEAVSKKKGIYFFFMRYDAFKKLSTFCDLEIKPLKESYVININGIDYYLVYLGTAGVRNNQSGNNDGHLRERLEWHLCKNKTVTALCAKNGSYMSTFRRTIAPLISDDLIGNNTQSVLDDFLCKYFIIYYLEYPGSFLEVKDIVNSDEDILIKIIRPLFNLDKNENAKNPNHITHAIQQRRLLIEESSKKRWCNDEAKTTKKSNKKNTVYNKHEETKVINYQGCIEFKVKRHQNISHVAGNIPNLPVGPCSIELFYDNRNDVRIYVNGPTRNIRTANRLVSQYFDSDDTKYHESRRQIVFNEMNNPLNSIKEITVRVCPL